MMKRFLLAVALLAFPAVTWAQPQPVSPFPSVPMPVFGQPSVNGGNINPSKVGVDASTCAAPGVYLTSAPTTGIAFTATPSVILCVNGTAIVTTTGSAVTSTVPFLGPDGTSAAPTFSFSGETTLGIYKSASSGLGVTTTGYSPGPAVQFGSASLNFGSVYALSFASGIAATNAPDTFLLRGAAAATLQMGVNAAGVTDQLFKGPDRITSDGVGGNLTIAGGRNRGASAGGSIIFQTSPAAGAGVTGTLATVLTIDSTKEATFVGGITSLRSDVAAAGRYGFLARSTFTSPADGQANFTNNAISAGIGLDFSTDGLVLFRNRAQNGAGAIGFNTTMAISGTAPTAAGTGMAFTVGTGSTAFDWSITITTANAQSAFVLTLPTASNAWTCWAENFTTSAGRQINMTARSATTVTLTQISTILGTAVNFADNDVIVGTATAH